MSYFSNNDYTVAENQRCPRCIETNGMEPTPREFADIGFKIESNTVCKKCNGTMVINTKPILIRKYRKRIGEVIVFYPIFTVIIGMTIFALLSEINKEIFGRQLTLLDVVAFIFLYSLMSVFYIGFEIYKTHRRHNALLRGMKNNTPEDVLREIEEAQRPSDDDTYGQYSEKYDEDVFEGLDDSDEFDIYSDYWYDADEEDHLVD